MLNKGKPKKRRGSFLYGLVEREGKKCKEKGACEKKVAEKSRFLRQVDRTREQDWSNQVTLYYSFHFCSHASLAFTWKYIVCSTREIPLQSIL